MNHKKICYLIGAADFGFPEGMAFPDVPGPEDLVICADAGMIEAGKQTEAWRPDHLIGDFDSLEEAKPGASEELFRRSAGDAERLDADGHTAETDKRPGEPDEDPSGTPSADQDQRAHLHILPPEKNLTDLQAAWRLGQSLGYRNFVMTGCFGGRRFDHSLGNLHLLLSMAREGGHVCACSKDLLVIPLLAGQTFDSERGILSEEADDTENREEETVLFSAKLTGKNRYLSLVPAEGGAHGVTIRGLKYEITDGEIPAGSTLGISNEILAGKTFSIRTGSGSLWVLISEK